MSCKILTKCYTFFDAPQSIADESSVAEPLAVDDETGSFHLEFEIVVDSKRRKNKLTNNRGYTYNVKRQRRGNTGWQYTVRPEVGDLYLK